jgi:hypothetical protein
MAFNYIFFDEEFLPKTKTKHAAAGGQVISLSPNPPSSAVLPYLQFHAAAGGQASPNPPSSSVLSCFQFHAAALVIFVHAIAKFFR